ncbi:MAG: RNA polymerase sigma factor [Pseudomonadota bacterium]
MDGVGRTTGAAGTRSDVFAGLEQIYPRLWRYALVLTRNRADAEDLAQTACVRAMDNASSFTAGTAFDRWIFRITHRLWLNEVRARHVRRGQGLVPADEVDIAAEDQIGPNDAARDLIRLIMQLPEAQRVVVVFVYIEGYTYREAAEILAIPIGTVMSRLAAARERLCSAADAKKGAA